MRIPYVFQQVDGCAIPEFVPGMEWVTNTSSSVLTTYKIDGLTVKIDYQVGGWAMRKETAPEVWVPVDRASVEDGILWRAFESNNKEGVGVYRIWGPGIKNNPQNASKLMMVKVLPVANVLILYGLQSGIERKSGAQRLFDTCRTALGEGDAEGVVFQWEEPQMKLKAWGQVTRQEFGFSWPIPAPLTPSQAVSMIQMP